MACPTADNDRWEATSGDDPISRYLSLTEAHPCSVVCLFPTVLDVKEVVPTQMRWLADQDCSGCATFCGSSALSVGVDSVANVSDL
jgi:hypothetical protein